jgi:PTH1 family peptidyl-tRNA hydrolase
MGDSLLGKLRRLVTHDAAEADDGEYAIRLVVGLGNPGDEYADTRHNLGFRVLNRLAKRHGITFESGSRQALGRGNIAGREVILAKPRTYVNKSGDAVWNLIKQLKLDDAREMFVVCDDLDLPVGKVRLRASGGYGGQRGLKSIIDRTGNDQFPRLRIGIGRPVVNGKPSWDPEDVADYVLSAPPPQERGVLEGAIERAADATEVALAAGIDVAMSRYNT